jgi:lauroyl/myristoyl acyltransferase
MDELIRARASQPHSALWSRYFVVKGESYLDAALQEDQGILLVGQHSPIGFAMGGYIEQRVSRAVAVGNRSYRQASSRLGLRASASKTGIWTAAWKAARTVVALEAYQLLLDGGLVSISGDDEDPLKRHQAILADRVHHPMPGFAELAVATGSSILPTHIGLLENGRICMTVLPPLVWDRSERPSTQVREIILAYCSVLTDVWRQVPSVVLTDVMRRHLGLPTVTPKPNDETM